MSLAIEPRAILSLLPRAACVSDRLRCPPCGKHLKDGILSSCLRCLRGAKARVTHMAHGKPAAELI